MNTPNNFSTATHFNANHFNPADLVPDDDEDPQVNVEADDEEERDCPFPWWWIVLAGVVGAGVGGAIGYSQGKDAAEEELREQGRLLEP